MLFLTLLLTLTSIFATPAAKPGSVPTSPARYWAVRLTPGQDPRVELERFAVREGLRAGFIASCVGSVSCASVRFANQPDPTVREGHFEIVSLSGTLARDGMHLHASFSDSTGTTFGGHLMDGSRVHSTMEVVIGELDRLAFMREPDPTFGYRELVVRKR